MQKYQDQSCLHRLLEGDETKNSVSISIKLFQVGL